MKIFLQACLVLICVALSSSVANASQSRTPEELEHDKWLKLRFSEQHKNLIPIVAVADMFFACDKAKNSGNENYQIDELVESMDRNLLAEKLSQCRLKRVFERKRSCAFLIVEFCSTAVGQIIVGSIRKNHQLQAVGR